MEPPAVALRTREVSNTATCVEANVEKSWNRDREHVVLVRSGKRWRGVTSERRQPHLALTVLSATAIGDISGGIAVRLDEGHGYTLLDR